MEDNPADVFLIREALKMAKIDAELYVVHDGEKAIAFLDAAEASVDAPCPDLIVLDINLPKRKGGRRRSAYAFEAALRPDACSGSYVLGFDAGPGRDGRSWNQRIFSEAVGLLPVYGAWPVGLQPIGKQAATHGTVAAGGRKIGRFPRRERIVVQWTCFRNPILICGC